MKNLRRFLPTLLYPFLSIGIALVVYFTLLVIQTVSASTHYSATVTGYAFGHRGASGQILNQDGFANHQPGQLCNGQRDWSGDWMWGTHILMDSSVPQRDINNNIIYRKDFYLRDNGDPQCSGGMNWADLHFGNYTIWYFSNCSCGSYNVPNPVCYPGFNSVDNW